MSTKLARIAELAKENPKLQYTSLAHLLDAEFLSLCHAELKRNKAPGIDQITKDAYEEKLQENIASLVARLKTKSYRPQPVKRVYIPKPGSDKKRPLGIPAYEDKIIQMALAKILSAIHEPLFIDCSCGFRPNRSAHDALKLLAYVIDTQKVNYVVDADIHKFFDQVNHGWIMKFLEHRIKDTSLLHLIRRILQSGVMEDGAVRGTREGTPQGGNLSPVLANIYLHYVLDLWFEKIVRKRCEGEAYMVRYADDFVCCFQKEYEAERFYRDLHERLGKFNLTMAEEKSTIIEFGRFAALSVARKTGRKPNTFDFLGFTHYCSLSRHGNFRVKRKTSRIKFRAALQRMKKWIREVCMLPADELVSQLHSKLLGYYHYYGITDNTDKLHDYQYEVQRLLFKRLNRRSQRKSFHWAGFYAFWKQSRLPEPKLHVNIYDRRPHIGYVT